MDETAARRLDRRRQFILAPYPVGDLEAWKQLKVARDYHLHAHPDLPILQVRHRHIEMTLLGFLVDPTEPSATDKEILERTAGSISCAQDAPVALSGLAGRWALFVHDGSDTIALNDPCGLRELYYTTASTEECWCASQPTTIARILDLPMSLSGRKFVHSGYYCGNPEPFWPGWSTPFVGMAHLTPNHFLNLDSREVKRFWPCRPIIGVDREEGAQRAAACLRSLLEAVASRYALALPVTAGWDSRTLLAATRQHGDVYYYTVCGPWSPRHSADRLVPPRLLKRLGRPHREIRCPDKMSPDFAAIYCGNVTTWHDMAGAMAEGLCAEYPQDRVSVSGHASEIARLGMYVRETYPSDVDSEALAVSVGMNPSESAVFQLALPQFAEWLDGARHVEEDYGYPVPELFYWEQRVGQWAANGQSQWDIVHDRFTPFSCRPLLEAMLGTRREYRSNPDYLLYRDIITQLWPGVMCEPINPSLNSAAERLKWAVRPFLRRRTK